MTSKAMMSSTSARPSITQTASGILQRKCDCGTSAKGGTKCPECEKAKSKARADADVVQRVAADRSPVGPVPSIVHDVLRSPGQRLDAPTLAFFESRFGADFSGVRVHTDGRAAESAREVRAHAYTVGNEIVFGQGKYAPDTVNGRLLIAHELTHTLQQGRPIAGESLVTNTDDDSAELEAKSIAIRIASSKDSVSPHAHARFGLQRATDDCDCPEEKMLDARPPSINQTAELHVTNAYRSMVTGDESQVFYGGFPYPVKESGSGRPIYGFGEKLGDLPGITNAAIKAAQESNYRGRPDIVDFRSHIREVYDVTTVKEARDKVKKIQQYTGRLNAILDEHKRTGTLTDATSGTDFTPGVKFSLPPGKLRYSDRNLPGIQFCFRNYGSGVIAYCAIRSSNSDDDKDMSRSDLEVNVGQKKIIFKIPVGPKSGEIVKKSSRDTAWISLDEKVNEGSVHSIPGMEFLRYEVRPGQYDRIQIAIVTQSAQRRNGLPLNIEPTKNVVDLEYNKKTKKLSSKKGGRRIPFDFPRMSLGELSEVILDEEKGLSGKGVIHPSIPLLKGAELQIAFSGEELRVTAPVPKEKLKSLPGLHITEAALNFELSPEFKPSGDLKFSIGPEQKALGTGSLSVSADEQGFLAEGDLDVRIPGLDAATGKVSYRKESGWQGKVDLTTSKSFVKNAKVSARLSDKGFEADGSVTIELPGDQAITLDVARIGEAIVFKGNGKFKVPGGKLKDVDLAFLWNGDQLTATGETGFDFKGFTGLMKVQYHDGKVSGSGGLDFVKGKAKGKLNIKMIPGQKFTGAGEVTYKLTENLIATAGIAVDENEKVTLKGALEFPKPIELFKPFGGEKEIFSTGVSIPIPGASIGLLGLKARIEGGLSAGYRIGPGELRNVKLQTMLNPFEENPDVDLKLSAQLYIGANAHVSGSVSGAIMVDAAIASASGGLRVTVTAELDGHLAADSVIEYQKGHFAVEGNLDVLLKLLFKLALDSFVKAEAGVGPFKVKTEKDWRLAAYTYDPGLQIGIRSKAPIRYDSSQAFQAPSLDQIEIVKPNLNLPDMMQKIFASSSSSEVERK